MLNRRTRNLQLLSRTRRAARSRLSYELLEPRHLLAAEIGLAQNHAAAQSNVSAAPITWFETVAGVKRIPLASLATVDRSLPAGVAGPIPLATGEWIVQLRDEATASVRHLAQADTLLDDLNNDFTIISGLGTRGTMLVRGSGVSQVAIETSLHRNPNVENFSLNQLIEGQSGLAFDPDFQAGMLPELERINIRNAWSISRGSLSTVVGVLDTGIDMTHPDLYLNIWLNQGEIPAALRANLDDIDKDGLFTFYDLNNVTIDAATGALLFGGWQNGPNGILVADLNNNGRIDALDLLLDPRWTDGLDLDGNGFVDDIVGVNFRAGAGGETFAHNNPSDELGHGTHVAGTIGAIGGNGTRVVGVNWQTSLMSLKILDNNNQGDSASALRAVNYARDLKDRHNRRSEGLTTDGANVRVLNNSWGQQGGYEIPLEAAIRETHEAGILFVAAAGNGSILGSGIDNDLTPFYPAGYDSPNMIVVGASDQADRITGFSNFGSRSVDLLAPGVSVRSTLPRGAYGLANGTSMATPHVAGTAALIWSAYPEAAVEEVRQAILTSVVPTIDGQRFTSSGGRLDAAAAINADVFAPVARLVFAPDRPDINIRTQGVLSNEFTVEFFHPNGVDTTTIDGNTILVTHQWGPTSTVAAQIQPDSLISSADKTIARANFVVAAPGLGNYSSTTPVLAAEFLGFASTEVIAIDETLPSTIQSQLLVEGITELAGDMVVTIDIEHAWTSDLTGTLIAPNGRRVQLFSGVGGSGDNFEQTVFTDAAEQPIHFGSAPFRDTFRPEQRLSSFDPQAMNGFWTLEIYDYFSADGGRLNGWSLGIPNRSELSIPRADAKLSVSEVSKVPASLTVSADFINLDFTDVTGTLVSPSGQRVKLFSNLSGSHSPGSYFTFDDSAATEFSEFQLPGSGTFRPQESLSLLLSDGVNGDWKLELVGEITPGSGAEVRLSIEFVAPWTPLDFGSYVISTVAGSVSSLPGNRTIGDQSIGSFTVQIDDPSVLYVSNPADVLGGNSLRDAIITANSAGEHRTIILDSGRFTIDLPHQSDPEFLFPSNPDLSDRITGWSNERSGDFDITGSITIIGNQNDLTIIDGQSLDRVFKVHPGANLTLERVTVTGGQSPQDQGGGGILSVGDLTLNQVIVRGNRSLGTGESPLLGGGVAVWAGTASIQGSWIDQNESDFGAGIVYQGSSEGIVSRSTLSHNQGGGLHSTSSQNVVVENSTFSGNRGGEGALYNRDIAIFAPQQSPSTSGNGRFVAYVEEDAFGRGSIFIHDRETGLSEDITETLAGRNNRSPVISSDGQVVAFVSTSSNSQFGDSQSQVYIYDHFDQSLFGIVLPPDEFGFVPSSFGPSISDDGRFVAFEDSLRQIFYIDRVTGISNRISISDEDPLNVELNYYYSPSISGNGRLISFYTAVLDETLDLGFRENLKFFDRERDTVETAEGLDDDVTFFNLGYPAPMSADGRFVVSGGDRFGGGGVRLYDRETASVEPISVSADGTLHNAFLPAISADGMTIAFFSDSPILESAPAFGASLYVRDRGTGTTQLIPFEGVVDANSAPSISDDGNLITFAGFDAIGTGIFTFDRVSEQVTPLFIPGGLISADQVTVVETRGSSFAVSGGVVISDSLLVNPIVSLDSTVSIFNIVDDLQPTASLYGPLTRHGHLPPVHPLLRGNPAIDRGSSHLIGTVDQLGNIRVIPDIGAVEAVDASVAGVVYIDLNQNQAFDIGEPVVPNTQIRLQSGGRTQTSVSNLSGSLSFSGVSPGTSLLSIDVPTNFTFSVSPLQYIPPSITANADSGRPSLSGDGQMVVFESLANNLVYRDTNRRSDIFVYRRSNGAITLASVPQSGLSTTAHSSNAAISADGNVVTHLAAGNLYRRFLNSGFTEELFEFDDSFFIDNTTPALSADGTVLAFAGLSSLSNDPVMEILILENYGLSNLAVAFDGSPTNGDSFYPSISASGRVVAFESDASNLVADDTNDHRDIFIRDRDSNRTEQASIAFDGVQADGDSYQAAISGNGRFVAFASDADNLVPDDANGYRDIFVYDRNSGMIERIVAQHNGINLIGNAHSPSISEDGRFVAYVFAADSTVVGVGSAPESIFVYDRTKLATARLSESAGGIAANGNSTAPFISADGRFVAFQTAATNLVSSSTRTSLGIVVAPNPLIEPGRRLELLPGDAFTDVNFGLIPNHGQISGRLFEDTGILNGVYDVGEAVLAGITVFIDENGNGSFDSTEPLALTDDDGLFRFTALPAHREHVLRVDAPIGLEQISPRAGSATDLTLFLPAGGTLTERDFAFRPVQTTGQSRLSALSGRVYEDLSGTGVFDASIDKPLADTEVYLDLNNSGTWDSNEPRVVTDEEGRYSFTGLGSQIAVVRPRLPRQDLPSGQAGGTVLSLPLFNHVTPLGNVFTGTEYPLFSEVVPFGNAQSVAAGNFNGDGFLDVVVTLPQINRISIRLNDGQGGFLPDEIDLILPSDQASPTDIVVGNFDDDTRLDMAVTATGSSKVVIFHNFDPSTRSFATSQVIPVGIEPISLVLGHFAGGTKPDLAVINKGQRNSPGSGTAQLLVNNGNGVFTAGPAVLTGGVLPVAAVVGNFIGDGSLDLAVVNSFSEDRNNSFGGVTILRGDGNGGLVLEDLFYPVQATPSDIVTADFTGDERLDLAVTNFTSNSVSILVGAEDGGFRDQLVKLGTARGAINIEVGDFNRDGLKDLVVANLTDRNISIFRNLGADLATGDARFEPLENIGVAQFTAAQRMPFVVGKFDEDISGQDFTGTEDIVIFPRGANTLSVLRNRVVDGAHRVNLTGVNVVPNLDFIVQPSILLPFFAAIANPLPILEDAGSQSITISNIVKGRPDNHEPLRFIVTSDNPAVIPSPGQLTVNGGTSTTFSYTPLPNANDRTNAIDPQQSRPTVLTVRAIDAGADGDFDTDDDGIFERSFTVSVLPVNDPPVFTVPAGVIVTQKAGTQAFANFITGLGPGGGSDEEAQVPSAFIVATDNSFFITPPAIDANGQLTFTPSPNKSGTVPVTVSVSDNGGRANGGIDTTTKTFVINILPVNDPPTINLAGNQSVRADAGLRNVTNFATGFQPGGGEDEASQVISDFIVTVDSPGLFSVLPSISVNGTLTYAPAIDRTGTATVSVQVRDSGGRANNGNDLSAVQTFTITVTPIPDTTRPTPVITPSVAGLTNQASFPVDVDFGEPVAGFTLANITVSAGTKSELENLGGGKFRFMYTGSDGSVTFNIAASITDDLAGNPNFAAAPVTRTVDTLGVTAVLGSTVANPTNAANFAATISFGEPVLDFALSDLTVLNGSATNLNPINAATGSYSVRITPTTDGIVTVLLPAGVVTDAAGNVNSAADPLIRTVDRTRPAVTLTTTEPVQTNRTTFDVFAQFSEPVTELAKPGLSISGGTAGNPILVSPGLYRIPITAAVGSLQIRVVDAAVNDLAGNPSEPSLPLTRTIDPTRVLPLLTTAVPPVTNADSYIVSINFSKQVVGFDQSSLFAVGAGLSDFTVVDEPTGKYSVKVTPASNGLVTLLLPANAATDLVGNGNLAAAPLVRTIDRVAPVMSLSSDQPSPTLETTFAVIVQSSKPISGLIAASFTVNGGSIGQPVPLSDGRYSVPVTAAGGLFEISIQAGAVVDAAGNTNAGSNALSIEVTPRSLVITPQQTNAAIDLSTLGEQELTGAETIDLRGQGDNQLKLDSAKIASFFTESTAVIYADPGDTLVFTGQWTFDAVLLVDGQIHRVFSQSGATVQLQGPYDFSNPINRFDVDASGDVAALDALNILNAIRAKLLIDADGAFVPLTTETLASFRFLDVDQNNQLAPLDALLVLIEMSRLNRTSASGEGEWAPLVLAPLQPPAQSSDQDVPAGQYEIHISTNSKSTPTAAMEYASSKRQSIIPLESSDPATNEETASNADKSLIDEAFADPLLLD